jgi:hypothetical protein
MPKFVLFLKSVQVICDGHPVAEVFEAAGYVPDHDMLLDSVMFVLPLFTTKTCQVALAQ